MGVQTRKKSDLEIAGLDEEQASGGPVSDAALLLHS
jgi:hypothetical protein